VVENQAVVVEAVPLRSGEGWSGGWSGPVRSVIEGSMTAILQVSSETTSTFSGVFAVPASLCIPGGSVSGTKNGSRVSFSGRNPFGGRFTVSGTVSGSRFSGSYSSRGSFSCNTTDTGTITLTK